MSQLAAVGVYETHISCRGSSILCGISAQRAQCVYLLSLNRFFKRNFEVALYFVWGMLRGQCLKIAPDCNATLQNKSFNTTSWWSRLVFRPAACLEKTPPKHAAEPLGRPCQPRASRRVGARFRIWVRSGSIKMTKMSCTKLQKRFANQRYPCLIARSYPGGPGARIAKKHAKRLRPRPVQEFPEHGQTLSTWRDHLWRAAPCGYRLLWIWKTPQRLWPSLRCGSMVRVGRSRKAMQSVT